MDIINLESELFKLTPQKRAEIADKLMESLDNEPGVDSETVWIEEAERRYNNIMKKKDSIKKAEDVMREAKAKYK